MDSLGIRYGLTAYACTDRASARAMATVKASSKTELRPNLDRRPFTVPIVTGGGGPSRAAYSRASTTIAPNSSAR